MKEDLPPAYDKSSLTRADPMIMAAPVRLRPLKGSLRRRAEKRTAETGSI
jgi:hypothetical protein